MKPRHRILTGPDASALMAKGKYKDGQPMYQRKDEKGEVLEVLVDENFKRHINGNRNWQADKQR